MKQKTQTVAPLEYHCHMKPLVRIVLLECFGLETAFPDLIMLCTVECRDKFEQLIRDNLSAFGTVATTLNNDTQNLLTFSIEFVDRFHHSLPRKLMTEDHLDAADIPAVIVEALKITLQKIDL